MDDAEIDWELQERGMPVIESARTRIGPERYAGAWFDRAHPRMPTIGVAIVDPTQEDVEGLENDARGSGWWINVHIAKYSEAQLIGFYEHLVPPEGSAAIGVSCDRRINRVVVELNDLDDATIRFFRERIPEDALLLKYAGDVRYVTTDIGIPR